MPIDEKEQHAWDLFAAAALSRVDPKDKIEDMTELTAWSASMADLLIKQRRMRAERKRGTD